MPDEPKNMKNGLMQLALAIVDNLKSSPGLLVIAFLSALLFVLLFTTVAKYSERHDEHLMEMIRNCMATRSS